MILALSRLLYVVAAFIGWLIGSINTFFDDIHEARIMARRFEMLARLPDSELAELGLKRQDIARAVFTGSYS
jgi:hypothetical protein